MATITIELTEALTEFIDREVASRGFQDRGEFVRVTLALRMLESEGRDKDCECFMYHGKPIMTLAQEKRLEQSLVIAEEEFERGECAVHQPGDFHRMYQQLLRQREEQSYEHTESRSASAGPGT